MDPMWGWFEWMWFAASWTVPAIVVGKWWLLPRLKRRQWWALVAAPVLYVLAFVPMSMLCCKPYYGARENSAKTACNEHLRELARAILMYADAHGDRLPSVRTWRFDVAPFFPASLGDEVFRCPRTREGSSYAFNAALSRKTLAEIPEPALTVLVFEAESAVDTLAGGPELLPRPPRHSGVWLVAAVDGHTAFITPERPGTLRWDPEQVAGPVSRRSHQ